DNPWGISGPQFIVLYLVLLALPAVIMVVWSGALRHHAVPGVDSPLPGAYHFAYLAGGPDRVTDTALAWLISRQRLRVDSRGKLTAVGQQPPAEPLERELWSEVSRYPGRRVTNLRKAGYGHSTITSVAGDLAERGLVVPPARLTPV